MNVKYGSGICGNDIIQVWFGSREDYHYERMGRFGLEFSQWLDDHEIEYVITEYSVSHMVCHITDREQYVWLKLCIDNRNIENVVSKHINERISEEIKRSRDIYKRSMVKETV